MYQTTVGFFLTRQTKWAAYQRWAMMSLMRFGAKARHHHRRRRRLSILRRRDRMDKPSVPPFRLRSKHLFFPGALSSTP
jgi:hypothetical protein